MHDAPNSLTGIVLHPNNPPQQDIASGAYTEGDWNLLVSMATGAGKTTVATWPMLRAVRAVRAVRRAIYAAPLHAIAIEKAEEWTRLWPDLRVSAFHGTAEAQAPYADQDILVMTYERLDGLLRYWQQFPWLAEVGVVVIDEIHALMDLSRGPRLEGARYNQIVMARMLLFAHPPAWMSC